MTNEQAEFERRSVVVSGVPVDVFGLPGDLYFDSIAAEGSAFEPAVATLQLLDDADATFLDVGASIGLVSLAAAQLLDAGQVVACEPEPRAFACLEAATRHGSAGVTLVNAAVSDAPGRLRFHQDPNGTAWGMISDREPSIEVEVTTVDTLVQELGLERLDVLKVDVEGFECAVLRGAARTLQALRPVAVVELNPYCLWRHGRALPQDLITQLGEIYPILLAVGADATVERLEGRTIDDVLYRLGTTGGLVDIVACDAEQLPLLDFSRFRTVEIVDETPAETVEPVPAAEPSPPEWSPGEDLRRVSRAVGWRAKSLWRRLRR